MDLLGLLFIAGLLWVPLQVVALLLLRGGWRFIAIVCLAAGSLLLALTGVGYAQGGNLWPLPILLALPWVTAALAILLGARAALWFYDPRKGLSNQRLTPSPAERPRQVYLFELLYGGSVVVGLFGCLLWWDSSSNAVGAILQIACGVTIALALVLLTARRRSNVGRWILAILTTYSVAAWAPQFYLFLRPEWLPFLTSTVLSIIAVAMLFTTPAAQWFKGATD